VEQFQDAYSRRAEQIKRWNKKTYRERSLRLHRGSDLDEHLGTYMANGGSVNFLIAELLAGHFGVANPYKQRHIRTVEHIWP
jgi:hypothetical protein